MSEYQISTRLDRERKSSQKERHPTIDADDLEALTKAGMPINLRHIPRGVLNLAGKYATAAEDTGYQPMYPTDNEE